MTLILLILGLTLAAMAAAIARCPVVRIVARLFSACAERHHQARFQH